MVDELKPCPFCGGKADIGQSCFGKDGRDTVYQPHCTNKECVLNVSRFRYENNPKFAALQWNTRAESAKPTCIDAEKLVAELEESKFKVYNDYGREAMDIAISIIRRHAAASKDPENKETPQRYDHADDALWLLSNAKDNQSESGKSTDHIGGDNKMVEVEAVARVILPFLELAIEKNIAAQAAIAALDKVSRPKQEIVYILPHDVEIGPILYRKGIKLETLINAAKRWYKQALDTMNLTTNPLIVKNLNLTEEQVNDRMKPSGIIMVEKSKPENKEEFSLMLQEEYGYNKKLANLIASDVAGYGGFD